jgi:hypothetical protein
VSLSDQHLWPRAIRLPGEACGIHDLGDVPLARPWITKNALNEYRLFRGNEMLEVIRSRLRDMPVVHHL